MTEGKDAKVVPIRPQVVRELTNYVEKSWDLAASQDSVSNELWSSELKAFLDATTMKSLFFSEDWVFICVDLIANKISSQPLVVYKTVTTNGQTSVELVPDHPLNALIEQPNQWQDYAQWMYNTCVELYLMGNSIIWHAPSTGQLITLPTENVTLGFTPEGAVDTYRVSNFNTDESGFREATSETEFKQKDIIHVRRPNPSSMLWGLSPFVPGRKSILFNRYSSDYLNAFYLKQATPGLALSLDRTVNEDVALRQLRSFEMAYQGRKNTRRTLILPKGVSATPLTHTLSDQKLLDHINQNRETILGLLKIPKHELGLQTAGSLGSEEYRTALRNFWDSTLIPGMRLIEGMLTKFFQEELGEDHFFQFTLDGVEALRVDMQQKALIAADMLKGGLSINEVRQRVWEEEPLDLPDAQQPYILVQNRPVFAAPAGETAPPRGDQGQRSLPLGRHKLKMTDGVQALRTKRAAQLDQEESRTINQLAGGVIDVLVGMTEAALEVIESSNKNLGLLSRKDLPSRRLLKRAIEKALADGFEGEWTGMVARTLTSSIDLGYDQQLDLVFNAEARQEIQALRERDADGRRLSLQARGLDSFAQVSETHTERIMRQITIGQEKNESITDIMRRVAKALGTPGELAGKAEMIARTEALTAVSIGQAAATENAAEVIPGLKKAWLTAGDDRVRDSHVELDGDLIDVKAKFTNGLRHPRDVNSGDASEVINCRCTLLLVPPGEELELP